MSTVTPNPTKPVEQATESNLQGAPRSISRGVMQLFEQPRVVLGKRSKPFIAMSLFALTTACGAPESEPVPQSVFAMQVAKSDGLTNRAFPGRAKAASEVNRSFRVSGPLITFPVAVGTEAKKGDVLARLDPRPFENALQNLQGQLASEQANLKRAQADYQRLQSIYQQDAGAISQAALDRAQQERDTARAGVRALEASVKNAQEELSYTHLKAPFDGIVVETFVENFETVVAKQPILRLLDPSRIEFTISVPENLIGLAPQVNNIDVTFDAIPDRVLPASISKIGIEASMTTRTYPVTLLLGDTEEGVILPGMAGEATITSSQLIAESSTTVEVPATAVFSEGALNNSFVWVIDDASQRVQQRAVTVRHLSRQGFLLEAGLQPGEWIVTKGVNSLQEGQAVRILAQQGESA